MNKRLKYYTLIWTALLVLFNAICFVTPNEIGGLNKFGGAFWTGYIFITIAFVGQFVCSYFALKTDDKTKLFYNIPIIYTSYIGLILTLLFGVLCMAIPNLPNWICIVACLIILVFTAIAVIMSKAATDFIEITDSNIKEKTSFIKTLTADAESLISHAKTEEAKKACQKVFEAICFSDPMSNELLFSIEKQIKFKFAEFSNAVLNNSDNICSIENEILYLVKDRNIKVKNMK